VEGEERQGRRGGDGPERRRRRSPATRSGRRRGEAPRFGLCFSRGWSDEGVCGEQFPRDSERGSSECFAGGLHATGGASEFR
jgi:hypothetical protein